MSDVINLLPDAVANQIAAGEVIQRPASAVKELMENALDAGADTIKLVIKDAGKSLIQLIDNGCGMSPTDARMCFERHATSKISKADDLFSIRTMGFRGEALASIAAIAYVDLKTKQFKDELGTHIIMEGSTVKSQQAEAMANGTTFSIKNLYFNTPARRNFLKSNPIENRHIVDEFTRVAMLHPEIAFFYIDDDKQKFQLPVGNLKQRIVGLLGKNYNEKLLKVEEKTELVSINGYVGKPELAKKTRGEQFLFVNKRFIKHSYLNHAIASAYDEMISSGYFPSYFINLDIDPSMIDVNIHPTKTEVNFQDERTIYGLLRAAVKMALGKYSLSPQFEFDEESILDLGPMPPIETIRQPTINVNPNYNPFENQSTFPVKSSNNRQSEKRPDSFAENRIWQDIYRDIDTESKRIQAQTIPDDEVENTVFQPVESKIFQLDKKYIVTTLKSGLAIIDQQLASERILYDKFSVQFSNGRFHSQRLMFPETIQFSPADVELLAEIYEDLSKIGFEIERVKDFDFQINAMPSDMLDENPQRLLEHLLEQFKNHQMMLRIDKRQNILLSMAKNLAIKSGKELMIEEMQSMLKDLFISSSPEISPFGKKIIEFIKTEEISQRFKN